jgi:hypothetical protein
MQLIDKLYRDMKTVMLLIRQDNLNLQPIALAEEFGR